MNNTAKIAKILRVKLNHVIVIPLKHSFQLAKIDPEHGMQVPGFTGKNEIDRLAKTHRTKQEFINSWPWYDEGMFCGPWLNDLISGSLEINHDITDKQLTVPVLKSLYQLYSYGFRFDDSGYDIDFYKATLKYLVSKHVWPFEIIRKEKQR